MYSPYIVFECGAIYQFQYRVDSQKNHEVSNSVLDLNNPNRAGFHSNISYSLASPGFKNRIVAYLWFMTLTV